MPGRLRSPMPATPATNGRRKAPHEIFVRRQLLLELDDGLEGVAEDAADDVPAALGRCSEGVDDFDTPRMRHQLQQFLVCAGVDGPRSRFRRFGPLTQEMQIEEALQPLGDGGCSPPLTFSSLPDGLACVVGTHRRQFESGVVGRVANRACRSMQFLSERPGGDEKPIHQLRLARQIRKRVLARLDADHADKNFDLLAVVRAFLVERVDRCRTGLNHVADDGIAGCDIPLVVDLRVDPLDERVTIPRRSGAHEHPLKKVDRRGEIGL